MRLSNRQWKEAMRQRKRPKPTRKQIAKRQKQVEQVASEKIERVSAIADATKHLWFQGITVDKPTKQPLKYTEYCCPKCRQFFRHFYEITPDILEAMKEIQIKEECIP